MIKRKQLSKLSCLFLMLIFLSGCWDQLAIDERAYAFAIGLDKGEEENQIKITFLITNPELSRSEGGQGSNEPPREIITFQTNDLISAKDMANTVITKQVSYTQLGYLLVSEELAKDKNFVRLMYDVAKEPEIKRGVRLIVTKEDASQFLEKTQPKLETRVHKFFELILEYGIRTGYIPDTDINKYFRITEAKGSIFLGIYATTEKDTSDNRKGEDNFIAGEFNAEGQTNNSEFAGSAVFKEGRVLGTLTSEETRLTILLNDTLNSGHMLTTFPDPFDREHQVVTRLVKKRNNEVKINLNGDNPTIDITIPLYVEVLSNHSMINYAVDSKKRKILKNDIEERITTKFDNLIKKTQKEFKGEPFGWSLDVRKQFPTIPAYEKYNWGEKYPDLQVNVSVNINFGQFGKQSEVPALEGSGD